ncbi:TetR/AcrR family transcriptional regulator [Micrococcus sp.]|uniref:TetR/AcrR family transcriptional regulator n=1 Tax=Micrococcus sp. TaxID=1271 RepID=UPI002A91AA48|nr:TetR/AcrR family transcriptional regulator [Micrococcus sp.]MDY6054568.1 TetR/AcrR family transcriptional regulator [Micrococcus sp.]
MTADRPAAGTRLPRAERRLQLLSVARTVFSAEGYSRAAMDAIAEAALVSKPVLYQHFPGKHELFLELMDTEVQDLLDRMQAALAGPEDNQTRVSVTVQAVFDYMDSPDRRHRILFDSGAELDAEVVERLESVMGTLTRMITPMVQERTPYDLPTAELIARGTVAQVFGSAHHWADQRDLPTRPSAAEAAAVVSLSLWHGLDGLPEPESEPTAGR